MTFCTTTAAVTSGLNLVARDCFAGAIQLEQVQREDERVACANVVACTTISIAQLALRSKNRSLASTDNCRSTLEARVHTHLRQSTHRNAEAPTGGHIYVIST